MVRPCATFILPACHDWTAHCASLDPCPDSDVAPGTFPLFNSLTNFAVATWAHTNMGPCAGTSWTGPPGHMMHPATFAQDLKNGPFFLLWWSPWLRFHSSANERGVKCLLWMEFAKRNGPKIFPVASIILPKKSQTVTRTTKQVHFPLGYLPVGDSCLQLRSRINTHREGRQEWANVGRSMESFDELRQLEWPKWENMQVSGSWVCALKDSI